MRYFDSDDIIFRDADGRTHLLKDSKPIEEYTTLTNMKIKQGDKIDEICSRTDIYGKDNEDFLYKVVEHNKVKLMNADFDFSKIKEIGIPLP